MNTDLRTNDGILDEIEEIVKGVKTNAISKDQAQIRTWSCKNAIRVMALKIFQQRFGMDEISTLPRLQKEKNRYKALQ